MTSQPPPDTDVFTCTQPHAHTTIDSPFVGLVEVVDDYRRTVVDAWAADGRAGARQLAAVQRAEQAIIDRLRVLGWQPVSSAQQSVETAGRPVGDVGTDAAGEDLEWEPVGAARALVDQLAIVDRDSGVLCERLGRSAIPGWAGVVHAAQRCHALVADALLIGAVDLAVRLGIPDRELPA